MILCQGSAQAAKADAQRLLDKLGLTLNAVKTRVLRAWQENFDFLGYTFGKLYTRNEKRLSESGPPIGTWDGTGRRCAN